MSTSEGPPPAETRAAVRDRLARIAHDRSARLAAVVIGPLVGWAVLARVLPNGLPLGVVVLGGVTGALASFTALGLVLIYRSSRIVNFAQAEIGGVAATVAVLLVSSHGVSYFLAFAIGLAIALVSGAVIELTVVRRFFQAPRLILTVATIGLAQLLGAATLFASTVLLTTRNNQGLTPQFTTPFDFQREIFPATFTGNHLLAVAAVIAVMVGLVWLFNRTDVGIGVRGAADSQERALLLGIPVRRLSSVTWIVAAGMSGLAGMLSAGVTGYSTNTIAGPSALLAPLAAAVLARFESLPTTFIASLGIGVFSQAVFWSFPRATTVDVALFALILVALLLQRRATVRVAGEDLGGFVASREARVVPRVLQVLPEVRIARAVLGLAVVAAAVGIPFVTSASQQVLFGFIAIYAIIGVSLVVLTGWAGQVSLGQFAFVGLGAATTGSLLENAGWDYLLCLLMACVVGATAATVIGIPALRIPGLFLAPVTIAFAVAASTWLLNPENFEWLTPLRVAPPMLFDRFDLSQPREFYYFCVAVLAIALLLARNLRRSRIGRAVIAARDNERLASAVSITPVRVKLIAFAISGALAGLAGGLYVLAIRGVPSGAFNPDLSIQLFTMVVVGGLSSIVGAVLGGMYVYFAQYYFTGAAQLAATGAGLLLILLVAPGGLAEVLYRVRDAGLRGVARRRGLAVPGFEARRAGDRASVEEIEPAAETTLVSTARNGDGTRHGLLECDEIVTGYGHLQVLFGLDFNVPDGSIVALLGTNGSGKSTTLKTIAGLVPAWSGRITFDGEDITSLGAIERVQRGLVMVPAKAIFGSLTVRENLRLAGWVPRRRGDQDYLETALPRVFRLFPILEQRLDQRASLLSGGEQQMLAIAQGLLAQPRLLLIDELSLGLAPIVVAAILDVARELNKDGLPLVIVEQSINVSATIAEDSVFVEKGHVRFAGPTTDLLKQDSIVRSVFFGQATATKKGAAVASRNGHATRAADVAPVFTARGITKRYGSVTAVSDVDLDLFPGQILGVIGSNGAGKTTAFDIFSGFTAPDAGILTFNGIDVTKASASERASLGFGRTFQDVRLFPSLTAAESLAVSLERHVEVREPLACLLYPDSTARSEREVRRRVDELIDAFSLGRYRDTCVSDLSTGTRRVLELACAAAHRPTLLFLDEPSSGLSQAESEEMAEVLVDLAQTLRATVAIIEHDVPLVSKLSDELVCMDLGKIIARGKPESVLHDPEVVRSYLGQAEAPVRRTRRRQLRAPART
ncbi:MAG: hypothetical protein QOC92_287 [Acidimicrobiaceae bacterium]|jgi:ABC-type branched-subunit amino acid transport system ATPase component/ABC-type branched-subunit amino acid transport system permease subunit